MNNDLIYIEGKRIKLRPLLESDFTMEYLSWLNDPIVNRYSQRRPFPVNWDDMKAYNEYFSTNPQKGFVLAIINKLKNIHIGNIALLNIHLVNRCADIAILIGKKEYWNAQS